MAPESVPALVLLLHQGGWDEVLMVAAGLGIAYLVIVWSGRRQRDGDEEDLDGDEEDQDGDDAARTADADPSEAREVR